MSNAPEVALLTEARFEQITAGHWYTDNILEEDRLVTEALAARGIGAQRVCWSRSDVDWSRFSLAVFRSTWDYFDRIAEFSAWLDRIEHEVRLVNPADLVRWNIDKHYLLDLEQRGVHAVPTVFVERGDPVGLAELMHEHQISAAVIKPVVSGAARHTHRVEAGRAAEHEARWAALVAERAMMLQPVQRHVVEQGELTLVMFEGRFSHALRKVAKPGDFRVQDDHGGTLHPHQASPAEIELAERAMAACDPAPQYGRVDMIRDNDGELAVMELELVEPELWLRRHHPAADRMADAIARRLG